MNGKTDEYCTSSFEEYNYLREHGVFYTHTYSSADTIVYCYTKNAKLFSALSIYYDAKQSQDEYAQLKSLFTNGKTEVYSCSTFDEAKKIVENLSKSAQYRDIAGGIE